MIEESRRADWDNSVKRNNEVSHAMYVSRQGTPEYAANASVQIASEPPRRVLPLSTCV